MERIPFRPRAGKERGVIATVMVSVHSVSCSDESLATLMDGSVSPSQARRMDFDWRQAVPADCPYMLVAKQVPFVFASISSGSFLWDSILERRRTRRACNFQAFLCVWWKSHEAPVVTEKCSPSQVRRMAVDSRQASADSSPIYRYLHTRSHLQHSLSRTLR